MGRGLRLFVVVAGLGLGAVAVPVGVAGARVTRGDVETCLAAWAEDEVPTPGACLASVAKPSTGDSFPDAEALCESFSGTLTLGGTSDFIPLWTCTNWVNSTEPGTGQNPTPGADQQAMSIQCTADAEARFYEPRFNTAGFTGPLDRGIYTSTCSGYTR